MFFKFTETAPQDQRRWIAALPIFAVILIPLASIAGDLRITFAASSGVFAIQAVVARRKRGLGKTVQAALWIAALAFAAASLFFGRRLH